MAEDENVTIIAWPKEPAALEHQFNSEKPCPVSISFTDTPAHVIVSSDPDHPVAVDMDMKVTVRETIPLCIKLCEPICARSDYTIGINIFDNPFASINVRGLTRLYNCQEQPPEPEKKEVCVTFERMKAGTPVNAPFAYEGLTFSPLGSPLRAATFGEPAGEIKLAFPPEGMRIEFPQPVEDVCLTLNNYAQPDLTISAYAGANLLTQFTVSISNTVQEVRISKTGVTAVTVTGGNNEAALVKVCYQPTVRTIAIANNKPNQVPD
jgi:hypothetical protein